MQTADDVGDFLAEDVNCWDEGLYVVDSRNEDLIFYCFGFLFYGTGVWFETVDYVIAVASLDLYSASSGGTRLDLTYIRA
jgi:hypothetical protein